MEALQPSFIATIRAKDGIELSAAVYLPEGAGRFPALFAASPYRFDNNVAPALPIFLWRETGPIDYYLSHGYAFVHLDVRGTGRSGGEYRYMCQAEQRDLYDVIVWITQQAWSNGKVGGIGQSYYARMQWFMGIQKPPGLACIAPYDGNVDTYRSSAYTGGIPGAFPSTWYNSTTRNINLYPASGPSRFIEWDYVGAVKRHNTYDEFWKVRAAAENLDRIKVPVFSIGVWTKVDLHLNGNIVGFERTQSSKKLLVFGSSSLFAAVADFSSVAFHETYLRPFYDCYLKGGKTSYPDEPDVRYFVPGAETFRSAASWPPANISYRTYYLGADPTGSVASLNDGSLSGGRQGGGSTSYDYPNPQWRAGVVGFDKNGRPDPVRNVLTFTSAALEEDMEIAGPIQLNLHASSTNRDTDFVIKLSEQFPQDAAGDGGQPRSRVVTKGWLRASHRAIDRDQSRPYAPWYSHVDPEPIEPGKVYAFEIAVMPTAYRFSKGSRIRLEIANGDSQLTESCSSTTTRPRRSADTIHHSAEHPSHILLPVVAA
jgi:predicted acyl esterase